MISKDKRERLSVLAKVPLVAALDHRYFLDSNGKDVRLGSLPRKQRRRINADAKRIGAAYKRVLEALLKSGAGFQVDKFLRELAFEYTHRYASSGLHSQPLSFNYFESFCDFGFLEKSVAPYAAPRSELDHLFGVQDFFNYITEPGAQQFRLADLHNLPEGKIFHFTPAGNISDLTFLTAEGREFVIAGFSLVRHRSSLHWFAVGGEIFPESEWQALVENPATLDTAKITPHKHAFLSEAIDEVGRNFGQPVALEGTARALRTVIAGETDLDSAKHLGRCYMSEYENSFSLLCDDPDVFNQIAEGDQREEMLRNMADQVKRAAAMWNLAEAMFQLPTYFDFKVGVVRSIAVFNGRAIAGRPKSGRGVTANFRYVSSLEISDTEIPVVRAYAGPSYQTETEGHWRRLPDGKMGYDKNGKEVRGKTWVRAANKWREFSDNPRTIYVKSSVGAARLKVEDFLARAQLDAANSEDNSIKESGVLYALRCTVMKDEVYKVGWTSETAEHRAKELSSATGVPSAFVVVASWKHADPEALEREVHAMLSPYRLNESREFFQVNLQTIKSIVEQRIGRVVKSR